MLRVTLHQMRASAGRLGAAAIAIILGTAFVATTLLANATMEATTHNTMAAGYANADLIIAADEQLTDDDLAAIRNTTGVNAADPVSAVGAQVESDGRSEWGGLVPTPADPQLSVVEVAEGDLPTAVDQVALVADVADRLDVGIGDEVEVLWEDPAGEPADDGEPAMVSHTAQVVGLLVTPTNFFTMGAQFIAHPSIYSQAGTAAAGPAHISEVMASLAAGAEQDETAAALREAADQPLTVQSVTERAEELTAANTGGDMVFTALLLGFAAVALAVAALVIANTFTVLVAQRTRSLALLRCVGASTAQIRRSVLLEALGLGVLASLAGLGLGVGLIAGGLAFLGQANLDIPLDTAVHLSPGIVAVVLSVGIAVTVGAALVPARLATRVAPLAAMRPTEGVPERGAGRKRAVLALTAVIGGGVLLVAGVVLARLLSEQSDGLGLLGGLALGVIGGFVSLIGLLVGAVFVVPRLIRGVGRLIGRGVPARIATANAVRNPRRTAATTSALIIGVTLVMMMSTGALAARDTLTSTLDEQFTVDLAVDVGSDTEAGLSPRQEQTVREHEDISAAASMTQSTPEVAVEDFTVPMAVAAGSADDLAQVLRDTRIIDNLTDETIAMPENVEDWYGIADGDQVELTGADGQSLELTVQLYPMGSYTSVLSPANLDAIDPEAPTSAIWARIADGADEMSVVRSIQGGLTEDIQPGEAAPWVQGAAAERAGYQQVIDTLLAVVVGLLGVAVLIALIGVANTLSLSVLERRRESAMLRAVGLTRGQLRGMLAIEGVLIAGAGAVMGIGAGLLYGWAGSMVVLSGIGQVPLSVPWRDISLVVLIALIAGLLASVLPARSAARSSPVAALAAD